MPAAQVLLCVHTSSKQYTLQRTYLQTIGDRKKVSEKTGNKQGTMEAKDSRPQLSKNSVSFCRLS